LANLLFARELQRQLSACGSQILSVAAHPGVVRTGLFGHVAGASGLLLDIPGGTFIGPKGFRQLRGFPGIVKSSKNGTNEELGRRLWELSESLTGARLDCGTPRPAR
jgi:hypothetical protein